MVDDEAPTRTRLLQAAVEVMAESGWSAVTSRLVAERARANNALVHYHFGTIDALRRAAVLHAMEKELEGPVGAVLRADDALDGVQSAIRRLAARGSGAAGQRVLAEALMHGLRDAELHEEGVRRIRTFRDALTDRLSENQAAGRLRADADPAALAVVIGALLNGLLLHVLFDPGIDVVRSTAGLIALLRPADPADL
ncbi:TetR family transcriptional regulator [Actinomadura pelletieri DSM 43383]|uniref:TetR family transcriptional regulator n=1 Tax=Actinomadura pelletieri DSM 43383 TaxID=1120940 RepID=A0A495QLL3_9ACTN|nr:TetR/AcrR family transcriptional regulator [Actinomadura pelletieri]RKS73413.1 TetR family transcriptional regulator [Actinomadura pelletieri DSM 43383]